MRVARDTAENAAPELAGAGEAASEARAREVWIEPEHLERTFGEVVRRLRQERGWTQAKLAGLLGLYGIKMHQTTFAKLEAGDRPIRLNEAAVLAVIFETDLMWMLDSRSMAEVSDEVAEKRAFLAAAEAACRIDRAELMRLAQELGEAQARVSALVEQRAQIEEDSVKHTEWLARARADYDTAIRRMRGLPDEPKHIVGQPR